MKKYPLQDLASAGYTLFMVGCVVLGVISAIIVAYSEQKLVPITILVMSIVYMYILLFCVSRSVCAEGNTIIINTVIAPLRIASDGKNIIKTMTCFSPLYFEDDENGNVRHYFTVFFVKTNQALRPWIIVSGYKDLEKVMKEAMKSDN